MSTINQIDKAPCNDYCCANCGKKKDDRMHRFSSKLNQSDFTVYEALISVASRFNLRSHNEDDDSHGARLIIPPPPTTGLDPRFLCRQCAGKLKTWFESSLFFVNRAVKGSYLDRRFLGKGNYHQTPITKNKAPAEDDDNCCNNCHTTDEPLLMDFNAEIDGELKQVTNLAALYTIFNIDQVVQLNIKQVPNTAAKIFPLSLSLKLCCGCSEYLCGLYIFSIQFFNLTKKASKLERLIKEYLRKDTSSRCYKCSDPEIRIKCEVEMKPESEEMELQESIIDNENMDFEVSNNSQSIQGSNSFADEDPAFFFKEQIKIEPEESEKLLQPGIRTNMNSNSRKQKLVSNTRTDEGLIEPGPIFLDTLDRLDAPTLRISDSVCSATTVDVEHLICEPEPDDLEFEDTLAGSSSSVNSNEPAANVKQQKSLILANYRKEVPRSATANPPSRLSRNRFRCPICQLSFNCNELTAHGKLVHNIPNIREIISIPVPQISQQPLLLKRKAALAPATATEEVSTNSNSSGGPLQLRVLPRPIILNLESMKSKTRLIDSNPLPRSQVEEEETLSSTFTSTCINSTGSKVASKPTAVKSSLPTKESDANRLSNSPAKARYYFCKTCLQNFIDLPTLTKHRYDTHKVELLSCVICTKQFVLKQDLQEHIKRMHPGMKLPCSDCGKEFANFDSLKRHKKYIHEEPTLKCPLPDCKQLFRYKDRLKFHLEQQHKPNRTREVMCDICGKGFYAKSTLLLHKKVKHSTQTLPCEICGRIFNNIYSLNQHLKCKHQNLNLKCEECGKIFPNHDYLKKHYKRRHATEEEQGGPWECDLCGQVFKLRQDLLNHKKSKFHGGKGKKGYPAKNKQIRKQPKWQQLGILPGEKMEINGKVCYQCEICTYKFVSELHLKYHKSRRHPKCGKATGEATTAL